MVLRCVSAHQNVAELADNYEAVSGQPAARGTDGRVT
jgi:hypothetical protein